MKSPNPSWSEWRRVAPAGSFGRLMPAAIAQVTVRQKRLSHSHPLLNWDMQTFSEVEQEAMKLPEAQRATLASRLLASLPAVLSDDDEGVAEALRRDAELERDPAAGMRLEELRRALKR